MLIHSLLKKRLANKYMIGTINTPNKVPIKRHPNGFIPNMSTPQAMNILPSGGCVFS